MTCFQIKCNPSWQGSSRVWEHRGLQQPAGERWMIISFLISRSVIKWHRQAPFNQEASWYHAVDPLVGFNPYFTKLQCLWQIFPLWVSRFVWTLFFCPADISKSLWASLLTFPPPRFVFCAAADIISTVEFNSSGELLATGDKGGRVVVFQREQEVGNANGATLKCASDKRIAFFHHLFLLIQHYHSLSF